MDFLRSGLRPSLRKSKVLYHKVTAILILFQLAIAICDKKIINEIGILLTENNIKYISFKGLCLAKLLYDDCGERKVGDIDIYVDYIAHNKTIKLLEQKGFRLEDDNQKDYYLKKILNGTIQSILQRFIYNIFALRL